MTEPTNGNIPEVPPFTGFPGTPVNEDKAKLSTTGNSKSRTERFTVYCKDHLPRIYMTTKSLFTLLLTIPFGVGSLGNGVWTITRGGGNLFTFLISGYTPLNAQRTAMNTALYANKATRAIFTGTNGFLIAIVSPKNAEEFHQKFGPQNVKIQNDEEAKVINDKNKAKDSKVVKFNVPGKVKISNALKALNFDRKTKTASSTSSSTSSSSKTDEETVDPSEKEKEKPSPSVNIIPDAPNAPKSLAEAIKDRASKMKPPILDPKGTIVLPPKPKPEITEAQVEHSKESRKNQVEAARKKDELVLATRKVADADGMIQELEAQIRVLVDKKSTDSTDQNSLKDLNARLEKTQKFKAIAVALRDALVKGIEPVGENINIQAPKKTMPKRKCCDWSRLFCFKSKHRSKV